MRSLIQKLQRFWRQPSPHGQAGRSSGDIQILSDLHLEVGQQYRSFTFPVSAPFLLLAGDIGRLIDYDGYLAFLQNLAPRYHKIFLVLGNHEFYGLSYEDGLLKAQQLSSEPAICQSVILLHKSQWDGPSFTVIGCTLWSMVPAEAREVVKAKINDFKKIEGWSIEKHNELYQEESKWLEETVRSLKTQSASEGEQNEPVADRFVLLATHHAPSIQGTSRPEHLSNPWTSAFASDLLKSGEWEEVDAWVFGHTHYCTDIEQAGVRLIANQRGYVLPGNDTGKRTEKSSTAHEYLIRHSQSKSDRFHARSWR